MLEKRVDSEGVGIWVGDHVLIHGVWGVLAERGVGLLREPSFVCAGISDVVEFFEQSCKGLAYSEAIVDLEDCLGVRVGITGVGLRGSSLSILSLSTFFESFVVG